MQHYDELMQYEKIFWFGDNPKMDCCYNCEKPICKEHSTPYVFLADRWEGRPILVLNVCSECEKDNGLDQEPFTFGSHAEGDNVEMNCFLASFAMDGHVKWKNGKSLKLRMIKCKKRWDCPDTHYICMFTETVRTENGLISKPNPEGPKYFASWLKKNCPHPQKNRIIKFMLHLPVRGVLITREIEELIAERFSDLFSRS